MIFWDAVQWDLLWLFVDPDFAERFTKIIVDDFTLGFGVARSLGFGSTLKFCFASRLDGGDNLRDVGALGFGLHEETSVQVDGGIRGVLATDTLGNIFHTTALLQKAVDFLLQFTPDIVFGDWLLQGRTLLCIFLPKRESIPPLEQEYRS